MYGLELVSTLEDRHQRDIILDYRQLGHFLFLLLWKDKFHFGHIMLILYNLYSGSEFRGENQIRDLGSGTISIDDSSKLECEGFYP